MLPATRKSITEPSRLSCESPRHAREWGARRARPLRREDGAERVTHHLVAELEADAFELARHRKLPAEQRLRALAEQRFQGEAGRFQEARSSQQLTDDLTQLGVREWFGRAQIHRAKQPWVVDAALERGDLVVQVDPREALLAAADRSAHEQLER